MRVSIVAITDTTPVQSSERVHGRTNWRTWWPVVLMLGCSTLSYFDRQILAVLSPMILSDLKLSAQSYGQIITAFSLVYMVANPLWGTVLDRIGPKLGMTVAVTVWTLACASHSLLHTFAGFALARAFLGLGEGATFPGCLRTVMDRLPATSQSRGIAISYSGGGLGAILTPLLVTPIAIRYGWRAAFVVAGCLGLMWLVLWRTTVDFRMEPNRQLPKTASKSAWAIPNIFERRFWSLVVSYGLCALPLGLMLYLSPLYLSRYLGFSQARLGGVLWLPPLGSAFGYYIWGWFTDRFAAGNRRPSWLFFLLAFLGLPQVFIVVIHNSAIVLALMSWATLMASGFMVLSLRTSTMAYPSEQTGLVAGIGAGSWSAIVAVMLPLLGRMFDAKHYAQVFVLVGLLPVVGAMLWWLLTLPAGKSLEVNAA